VKYCFNIQGVFKKGLQKHAIAKVNVAQWIKNQGKHGAAFRRLDRTLSKIWGKSSAPASKIGYPPDKW